MLQEIKLKELNHQKNSERFLLCFLLFGFSAITLRQNLVLTINFQFPSLVKIGVAVVSSDSNVELFVIAQAEGEFRVAQADFDRQYEITKLLLESVSSAQVSYSLDTCLLYNRQVLTKLSIIVFQIFVICLSSNMCSFGHVTKHCLTSENKRNVFGNVKKSVNIWACNVL